MKKLFLLIAVLLMVSASAQAQTDYPSAEVFGGYTYLNDEVVDRESFHGWGFGIQGNLSSRFGLVSEFTGTYGNVELGLVDLDTSTYTYLFGPRVSARSERATGFAHILVGGATTRIEGSSGTDFALAVGGGVDVHVNKNISIRLAQVDYLPIFSSDTRNNFRYMGGVVIKFGGN